MSRVSKPNRKPRALNNVSIISDDSPLSGCSDGAETGLSEINNGDGQRVRQRLLSPVDVSLSGRTFFCFFFPAISALTSTACLNS